MFGKRKNGAKYVWEVKHLHKIQRSNEQVTVTGQTVF